MTDSEKIAALIQAKHLTNAQFCAATDLQPAALSHITSGRSKPSLAILRNIVRGFPDVNPMWLFGDEEAMYRDVSSTGSPKPPISPPNWGELEGGLEGGVGESAEGSGAVTAVAPSAASPTQGELFPAEGTLESAPAPTGQPIAPPSAPTSLHLSPKPPSSSPQLEGEMGGAGGGLGESPTSTPTAAASTVIIQQVPTPELPRRRNIVEIRVFYDDNTFEILTRKP